MGILFAYWSAHNFIDFELVGANHCESNAPVINETCIWGRNPFGTGPWMFWLGIDYHNRQIFTSKDFYSK